MSLRRALKGNPNGKTAWEHLSNWWSGDDDQHEHDKQPKHPLQGRYNPLKLSLGEVIEISEPKPRAYEISGVVCFEPVGGGERATRYELKGERPPLALEVLEPASEHDQPLYTLYQLVDEFQFDEELVTMCRQDDELTHHLDEGEGEVSTTYLKDATSRSRVLLHDDQGTTQGELEGFYYTNRSGDRFLTVELWHEQGWARFYVGRELRASQVMSLGVTSP
jgi:hypothetical protein